MATVIVDAENVRRSQWPNLSRDELVARARAWAAQEGHELRIVFDTDAPEEADDLVGTAYADDEIVRLANELEGEIWVATSDRELRDRLGGRVVRVVGGGTFVREI
jgi:predicted RNA-binding protein with PIN domain